MSQDFQNKISIVVREDLANWQVLNTVAHVSAYLGNKLGNQFGTGDYFITKDGFKYPRNTQYAIVVLSAKAGQITDFLNRVRESNLEHIGFIREMIDTTDDSEIESLVSNKNDKNVECLGVAVFGDKDKLKQLTKGFSLWK